MADPILVLFGQRIARERGARGWSRAELARRSGVKPDALVSYERAGKQPGVLAALRIADALQIPLGDLLAAAVCGRCDGFICGTCGRGGAR